MWRRDFSTYAHAVYLPYLGLGLYLAWVEVVFHASPLRPVIALPSHILDDPYWTSLLATVLLCVVLACLPTRVSAVVKSISAAIASAALMTIATVCVLIAYSTSWAAFVGGALGGLGMTLLFTSWGALYASAGLTHSAVNAGVAFALSTAIRLVLLIVPKPIALGCVLLLPAASSAFLIWAKSMPRPRLPALAHVSVFEIHPIRRLLGGIGVYAFIFGAFFGISRYAPRATATASDWVLYLLAGHAAVAILFIVLLPGKKGIDFDRLHRPVPILMAGGLVLLPLLGDNLTSPPMLLVSAAWLYIQILLWITLAALATQKGASGVRVFAEGLLVMNVGVLAGAAAGSFFRNQLSLTITSLAIAGLCLVYLLIMDFDLVISGGRAIQKRIVLDTAGQRPDLSSTFTADQPLSVAISYDLLPVRCQIVAENNGLSPRERDVLQHLARGLNADAIANALMLSRETVRTHIKHIYQKMGINSQQELLRIIGDVDVDIDNQDDAHDMP